jgi:lipopolysaccharide biosynthesis glycosyltransferase
MIAAETINVAFGVDAAYAPHLAAVIASIVYNSRGASYQFLVVHSGISRQLQERVEAPAARHQFLWIEVGDTHLPEFADRRHLTRATLHRLCLEKVAPPDCDRVIYLDADIAVVGDLAELWRSDLGGCAIGAVIDGYQAYEPFAERWGLDRDGVYFNAGVLLIDLEKVREERAFTKAMAFQAEHNFDLQFDDQDALNWVFWKRWQPLSVAWNVQAPQASYFLERYFDPQRRLGDQKPMIVHYTGPEKPWKRDGYHPWSWLYWEALARTSFMREVSTESGITLFYRLRLFLRWLRRRPPGSVAPQPMKGPLLRPATTSWAP